MFQLACRGFTDASNAGGVRTKAACLFRRRCGRPPRQVAREHGVFRTSKILRLEYGKLKRIVETATPVRPVRRATAPPAEFLELVAPRTDSLSECLIELEGPRGKMRIHWKGATAPDLAGLRRALWQSA